VNAFYPADPAARELFERGLIGQAVKTDPKGRFRLEGVFPGLLFHITLRKNGEFLITDESFRKLNLPSGEKDLGDSVAKPYRLE
jgi:hypothetical protein